MEKDSSYPRSMSTKVAPCPLDKAYAAYPVHTGERRKLRIFSLLPSHWLHEKEGKRTCIKIRNGSNVPRYIQRRRTLSLWAKKRKKSDEKNKQDVSRNTARKRQFSYAPFLPLRVKHDGFNYHSIEANLNPHVKIDGSRSYII